MDKFIKKVALILILLLVCIGGIQAQRDYREGYIITNEWDTIYGWIDYRGDIRNSQVCSFKETEAGQATDYSPLDIVAYRFIDSKFYISKNIGDDDFPKQIFLEYLVNGMANLYFHRESNSKDLYYIEKDGKLFELKIDEHVVKVDGVTRIRRVNSYVGVLNAALNTWEMRDEIGKAKLEHSSLINIAKNYHQYTCIDGSECIIYEKEKPLIVLRIGPVAGVYFSTLKMIMDSSIGALEYTSNPTANLTVGVNLNIGMPRLNEKLFLQMQANYTKYNFVYAYERTVKVSSNALQTGLTLKYEYPKGKLRPTLAAGGVGILLPDKPVREFTYRYFYGVYPSTRTRDFWSKFMSGFEITPGIHYYLADEQIVFIQMQYMQCYNNSYLNALASKIRIFGLSAGIYF